MSDTQIIVAVAVGASVFIAICCLMLIVVVRLRRVVKSQFETLENLLSTLPASTLPASTLPADRGRDTPPEPNAAKIGGFSKVLTCGNGSLRDSKLSGIAPEPRGE